MTVAAPLVLAPSELSTNGSALAPDCNPAAVYLARLAPASRRGMHDALDTLAYLANAGMTAETLPWHGLRYQHVQALRARLLEHYAAPASVNKALSALRSVLREAFQLGLIGGDDYARAAGVRNVRGTRLPTGRALGDAEVAALLGACTGLATVQVRNAALLAVLLGTGLRRGEVVALDVEAYHVPTGALRVLGKGDKERFCYVTNEPRTYLGRWLAVRGDASGPLFLPITKGGTIVHRRLSDQAVFLLLRRLAKRAGVEGFSPHDARRTFISNAIDASKDLVAVQALAGHASVSTTASYDRRGEASKMKVAKLLRLPIPSE